MRDRRPSDLVQGWVARIEDDGRTVTVSTPKRSAAYQHWFEASGERLEGRRGRLAEADPFVPPLLWAVLILAGLLVLVYMCFYADPGEPLLVQALMIGAVAARRLRTPHRALPRPALRERERQHQTDGDDPLARHHRARLDPI
jgi:hypothetical protein